MTNRPENAASGRSTSARVARNATSLLVAQFASLAVGFLFGIAVARLLGVAAFGQFTVLTTIYALASIFVHFGLQSLAVREVARDSERAGHYLSAFWRMKGLAALTASTLIVIGAAFFARDTLELACLILVAIALLIDAHNDAISLVFHGLERFREPAILGVIGGLAYAVFGVAALLLDGGVLGLFVAFVFAKLLQGAFARLWLNSKIGEETAERGTSRAEVALLFRKAIPFFFSKMFFLIYFRIDMLMLDAMIGDEAVGLYGVAYKFVNLSISIGGALAAALFPVMALAGVERGEKFDRLFVVSTRMLALMAVMFLAVLFVEPRGPLIFLYGDDYAPASPALKLLAWASAAVLVRLVFTNALLSLDREKITVAMGAIAVVLNIGLNLYLIPRMGILGAAWSTIACELTLTGSYALFTLRGERGRQTWIGLLRLAPALGVVLIAGWVLPEAWAWPLRVAASVSMAGVAALAAGALNSSDWERLQSVVPILKKMSRKPA